MKRPWSTFLWGSTTPKLEQIKPKIDSPAKHLFLKKLEREKAFLSLTKGSLEDVDAWLQTCGYKHTDTVSLHHVIEYLQLAKVLTEYGAYPEALQQQAASPAAGEGTELAIEACVHLPRSTEIPPSFSPALGIFLWVE